MALQAVRQDGTLVLTGDTVTDFRGDDWTFKYPSRPTVPGKSGKVIVAKPAIWDFGEELQGTTSEFYANVFDLTVLQT